jgi:AcrR family transcriptional regulator
MDREDGRMDEAGTREAIGRALLELLAEGRTASYGAAATRAGVSKGLVQHYFPDRTRLVRFAATTLAARLGRRLQAVPTTADAADTLVATLTALLPIGPDARLDAAAGRALFALALTDPEANTAYRQGRAALAAGVRDLLERAVPGAAPDRVERTCRDLLGTLDELATDLLLGELSAERAAELVRDRVADATG